MQLFNLCVCFFSVHTISQQQNVVATKLTKRRRYNFRGQKVKVRGHIVKNIILLNICLAVCLGFLTLCRITVVTHMSKSGASLHYRALTLPRFVLRWWLQLSTSIRRPFDGHSTAYQKVIKVKVT